MIISNTQKTCPYGWATQVFNIQIAVQPSKYTCSILRCIWILNSFLEFKLEGELGTMRLYLQIQGKKILNFYIFSELLCWLTKNSSATAIIFTKLNVFCLFIMEDMTLLTTVHWLIENILVLSKTICVYIILQFDLK